MYFFICKQLIKKNTATATWEESGVISLRPPRYSKEVINGKLHTHRLTYYTIFFSIL